MDTKIIRVHVGDGVQLPFCWQVMPPPPVFLHWYATWAWTENRSVLWIRTELGRMLDQDIWCLLCSGKIE